MERTARRVTVNPRFYAKSELVALLNKVAIAGRDIPDFSLQFDDGPVERAKPYDDKVANELSGTTVRKKNDSPSSP
jgi:hypothetical protein